MMILLKLILLTTMIVMALKIALSKNMLLEKLGSWVEYKSDEYKFFDSFICAWCMPALQSITAHAFAFGLRILPLEFNWQLLIRWPLVIFGASFLSGNLWNLYETVNSIKEKNDAEAEYYERCNEMDELSNKSHN